MPPKSPSKSPSPKRKAKTAKKKEAESIPLPPDDISKLDQTALSLLAKTYKLDFHGNKTVIQDRIMRFLKSKNLWKSKEKAKKRGKKRKRNGVANAAKGGDGDEEDDGDEEQPGAKQNGDTDVDSKIVVEVVPEVLQLDNEDPAMNAFSDVFSKFQELSQRRAVEDDDEDDEEESQVPDGESAAAKKRAARKRAAASGGMGDDDDDMDMDLDDEEANMEDPTEVRQSKKKLRKLNRMTVAQLKQIVEKPDIVEWVDVTSSDPLLLVTLKTARNTIPVPSHWSKKSAYLSGKRGYEKPPFELPEYIKATGIMQLRQTDRGSIGVAAQAKERAHPKLGRLDIDYQKLHDAFFRFQTRPNFSSHGDVYFQGREFDSGYKKKKPGVLSDDLKAALNIPQNAPPPWLINMQRYGPPPSYPQLQIPGLNAPIPEGAQWGFHPGGWGKPPTDEYNRPLYGDIFSTGKVDIPEEFIAPIEAASWGELEEEEYEEDDEEEEDDDDDEDDEDEAENEKEQEDQPTVEFETGKIDIETENIELRKEAKRSAPSASAASFEQKSLYTVLQTKSGSSASNGFMASVHTYDIPGSKAVEVSLNPEDLEAGMDKDTLKRKFEESAEPSSSTKRGHQLPTSSAREDVSDLMNDHAEKQSKKKSRREEKRDFKF